MEILKKTIGIYTIIVNQYMERLDPTKNDRTVVHWTTFKSKNGDVSLPINFLAQFPAIETEKGIKYFLLKHCASIEYLADDVYKFSFPGLCYHSGLTALYEHIKQKYKHAVFGLAQIVDRDSYLVPLSVGDLPPSYIEKRLKFSL